MKNMKKYAKTITKKKFQNLKKKVDAQRNK